MIKIYYDIISVVLSLNTAQDGMTTSSAGRRTRAFRSGVVLAGTVSAILIFLLGLALTGSIESKVSGATIRVSPPYATSTLADNGQTTFEQKCQGCHSIGGGQLVGPDLDGVTSRRDRDWLISFITSPDQLISQGDPLATELVQKYGMPMPNLGISEPEAAEVLAYIEVQSGSQPASSQAKEQPVLLASATGDAAKGRDIFTGSMPLENGGAACMSCHNIDGIAALGGGAVAKDLTQAYSNLGEAGLTSILKTTPFPLMKAIYEARPLEDDEVANLVVFMRETKDINQPPTTSTSALIFVLLSAVGFLIIAGVLQFVWRGRLSGVRRPLVEGDS